MTPDWITCARDDATRRGLPQVAALLDALHAAVERLRAADWTEDFAGNAQRVTQAGSAAATPGEPPGTSPAGAATQPETASQGAPINNVAASVERSRELLPGIATIAEAAMHLRRGAVSAVELTEAALDRIATTDPQLNAFITRTPELARAQAAAADADFRAGVDRGPLQGIPISLKDLIDVEGLPTTAASRVRAGHVAAQDAPVVARLRRGGAVIVGKTNLHEFALGTTNEDSAYGPARHPADPERSPGGSSGGSAVSVVTAMCLGTVGSDTGGSIRIPSALCGLVGLKPRYGEITCEGVVPLSRHLDHLGPLVRTVEDARLMYEVLAGLRPQVGNAVPLSPSALTLGLPRTFFLDRLQPEVRAAFDAGLERLQQAGVTVRTVHVPHASDAAAIYLPLVLAEAAALHAVTLETRGEDYTPPVRARLEMGRYVPGEDFARALRGQEILRTEVDAALAGCDALVVPTVPILAPRLGTSTVAIDGVEASVRNVTLRLTQPFNLTRHPAITLPLPVPAGTLPAGLQLVGYDTTRLLDVAEAVERALAG